MNWTVITYAAYLAVSLPLVVWVARTLSRHGLVFLRDVFSDAEGSEGLAEAVNRLLVAGFYLLNLGFVSLYLRAGADVVDLRGLIEELSLKIGVVTLVLGVVHVANTWVFGAMRRRHRQTTHPVMPPMGGPMTGGPMTGGPTMGGPTMGGPGAPYAPPYPVARR